MNDQTFSQNLRQRGKSHHHRWKAFVSRRVINQLIQLTGAYIKAYDWPISNSLLALVSARVISPFLQLTADSLNRFWTLVARPWSSVQLSSGSSLSVRDNSVCVPGVSHRCSCCCLSWTVLILLWLTIVRSLSTCWNTCLSYIELKLSATNGRYCLQA